MEDNEIICFVVIVVGVVVIYLISKHINEIKKPVQEGFDSTSAASEQSCDMNDQKIWVTSCKTTMEKKDEYTGHLCDLYDDAGNKLINLLVNVAKNDKNPDACAAYNTENHNSWINSAKSLMDVRKACDEAVKSFDSKMQGCSGDGGCAADETSRGNHMHTGGNPN